MPKTLSLISVKSEFAVRESASRRSNGSSESERDWLLGLDGKGLETDEAYFILGQLKGLVGSNPGLQQSGLW